MNIFQKIKNRVAGRRAESERSRIMGMKQPASIQTSFFERPVSFSSGPSFLAMYDEIFLRKQYEFEARTNAPVIFDVGANIGMASLYWAMKYPNAQINAFEPSLGPLRALEMNKESFGLKNVTIHSCAVGSQKGRTLFRTEEMDGGTLCAGKVFPDSYNSYEVQIEPLSQFLPETEIDLLKLDIEGSELPVLEEIQGRLPQVRSMFVEYHSFASEPQCLPRILEIISQAGFRYVIKTNFAGKRPLLETECFKGQDNQLNIFCRR